MQQQIVEYFHWLIIILIIKSDANFQRIPAGYSYVVILRAILSVESAPNCIISKDGKSADCSSKVSQIPNDLDSKITSLDLSSNSFDELRENSFKRYNKLTSLMLRDVKMNLIKVDLYLFRPLKELTILNMSGSDFTQRAYFYYPVNLKILNINGLGVLDVDVSQLKYLEELHAKKNKLLEFPITHQNAPLTVVDLESNYLETLTPARLALSCKLQVLNVQLDANAKLLSSVARYCICKRANLWMHSFKIKGEQLPCKSPASDEQCEEKFSEETLSVFNECATRNDKMTSYWIYLLIVVFVLALIGSSGAGYYVYITKIKPASSSSEQVQTEPEAKRGSSKVDMDELNIEENN